MKIAPDRLSPLSAPLPAAHQPALPSTLPAEAIRARDILIINPYCHGGGDEALAKKIANIALAEGCRVSVISFDTTQIYTSAALLDNHRSQNYARPGEMPHAISELTNPLFIIAPAGIADMDDLEKQIGHICQKHHFSCEDAFIIEEMDVLTQHDKKLEHYAAMLRETGFKNVTTCSLGFSDGAIGYIPTDEHEIDRIRHRFEGELVRLFDSYHLDLSAGSSYHLGYISSDSMLSGPQVFIANTLSETQADDRHATFILSVRQLTDYSAPLTVKAILDILQLKNESFNNPALFSRATVTVVDAESGQAQPEISIRGCGHKKVGIILTSGLPKSIYDDFLMLADGGMTSGDQSFSEYLSLKGTLPYYDMQPWKEPLMTAIKAAADPALAEWLDTRFVGLRPFSGERIAALLPNITPPQLSPAQLRHREALEQKLSSSVATPYIRRIIHAASGRVTVD